MPPLFRCLNRGVHSRIFGKAVTPPFPYGEGPSRKTGFPTGNHLEAYFQGRDPVQKPPYLSIRRILNTCPKTRFRYVTAIIPECGQSRPRFRKRSFSDVHRKAVAATTGGGMGISICSQTRRRFQK